MKQNYKQAYYWVMSVTPLFVMSILSPSYYRGSKEERIFNAVFFLIMPIAIGTVASSRCLLSSEKWYSLYAAALFFSIYVFIIISLCLVNMNVFQR
jgi:hypothetical protein